MQMNSINSMSFKGQVVFNKVVRDKEGFHSTSGSIPTTYKQDKAIKKITDELCMVENNNISVWADHLHLGEEKSKKIMKEIEAILGQELGITQTLDRLDNERFNIRLYPSDYNRKENYKFDYIDIRF